MKINRTCWLIINPISGSGRRRDEILRLVDAEFKNYPKIDYQVRYTEFAGHATELAASAVAQNIDQIIAIGGDGTLNEAASGLVEKETALSLIPVGSGNGFARSLGIPLKTERALRACLEPRQQMVDVGVLNDRYFFGVAGLGLDAIIGARFQDFGVRGPLPYFYIGLREFLKFNYEEIIIELNDRTFPVSPLLLTVANTPQYGNGAIIAPMAKYDDGMLDICIINKFPLYRAASQLSRLFNGTIDQTGYFEHYRTDKFRLIRGGRDYIHTDGEPYEEGNVLDFSIKNGALKIWC